MRYTFYSFFLIFIVLKAEAQDVSVKYGNTINAQDLKAHLTIVASDSFEGRGTAERGQKLAADYIAKQFQNFGLKAVVPKGDSTSYLQSFKVYKKSWDNPTIKIRGDEKVFLKDFFSIGNPGFETEEELELMFGGFGNDDFIQQKKSYYKGKGVVLLLGDANEGNSEKDLERSMNLIATSNYNKKYKALLESGAKAVFVIPGKNDSLFTSFLNLHKCTIEESALGMSFKSLPEYNVFFIPPSLGSKFLNITEERLSSLINKAKTQSAKDLKGIKPEKIKIKAFQKIEPLETENVLGIIEGTDKKDEVVIVTAHYDHEGIKCGEIYNGADDDGTGTVTILELAEAFSLAKKEGNGPRRSILLMTVTGEEKGLFGSKYYVNNPVFPIAQTVVDLNIDMIGRIDDYHQDENYVYLIGSNRLSRQLHQVSEDINFKYVGLELDYKYNAPNDPNQFYYRSDHYSFAKKGIPAIFYFSGTHDDYHKPTDDIEKIIFSKVEKTARLIFHTAWELANMEERIVVDVPR